MLFLKKNECILFYSLPAGISKEPGVSPKSWGFHGDLDDGMGRGGLSLLFLHSRQRENDLGFCMKLL